MDRPGLNLGVKIHNESDVYQPVCYVKTLREAGLFSEGCYFGEKLKDDEKGDKEPTPPITLEKVSGD